MLLSLAPSSSGAAPVACGPNFAVVPSPSVGSSYSALRSVAAKSPSRAWAVGNWRTPEPESIDRALFERWNGAKWIAIKGANVTGVDNVLEDVGIVSAKAVWAVGEAEGTAGTQRTLVERWTPAGVKVVKSPSPGSSILEGVEVVSAKDVWAVGGSVKKGTSRALIEHWNGKKWKIVPAHAPPGSSLTDIDALSASNVWAVGSVQSAGARTLVERWNGKKWKVVPSANRGTISNVLTGVAAIAANDVWAVGYLTGTANHTFNLVEHWNGKSWALAPVPSVAAFQNFLESVDSAGPNNVWAVGTMAAQETAPYFYRTMTLHWNGSAWQTVPSPSPGTGGRYNALNGVAALKSGLVWAVGDYDAGTGFDTLALRRCG